MCLCALHMGWPMNPLGQTARRSSCGLVAISRLLGCYRSTFISRGVERNPTEGFSLRDGVEVGHRRHLCFNESFDWKAAHRLPLQVVLVPCGELSVRVVPVACAARSSTCKSRPSRPNHGQQQAPQWRREQSAPGPNAPDLHSTASQQPLLARFQPPAPSPPSCARSPAPLLLRKVCA